MNTPAHSPAGAASPSNSCPTRPHTAHSSRTPYAEADPCQGTDGKQVSLYAVVLPAIDLLSGSEDTFAVVLELAEFETKSGLRRTLLGWHGPFPTTQAASDFVSQLAAQPPTPPAVASEAREALCV